MSAFSKRCFGSNNTAAATTLKKQQQQHIQLFQWQMAWSERAVAMFAKNDFSAKRESFQHAQTQTHTRTHTEPAACGGVRNKCLQIFLQLWFLSLANNTAQQAGGGEGRREEGGNCHSTTGISCLRTSNARELFAPQWVNFLTFIWQKFSFILLS